MSETKTEWYFIVNPHAGSGKTMSRWIPAERKLESLRVPYVSVYTDHKRHAVSLARDAAEDGYRKIVAVGGDGSIHETLCGIMSWCNKNGVNPEEFTLGVLPIGSGNDWIKSLGVPNDTAAVVDLIAENSTCKMDVIEAVCSGGKVSFMANCAGIGFDSHVCKRVNVQKEGGKRSKLIYLDGLLYTLYNLAPINVKIMLDGKDFFSGKVLTLAMGNGRFSGSGMLQVPLADNNDGLIDIMVLPDQPRLPLVSDLFPKLFNGRIVESAKIRYGKATRIDIAPMDENSDDIIELDGEIVGRLPMTISADGRKINVIHG